MKKFTAIFISLLLVISLCLCSCTRHKLFIFNTESTTARTTTEPKSDISNNTEAKSTEKLYYNLLSDSEKVAYDRIYSAVIQLEENFYVGDDIDADRAFELMSYVLNDHPDIFWTHGKMTYDENGNMSVKFSLTKERIDRITKNIDDKSQSIISSLGSSGSDYDKALRIFDYISEHTKYNEQKANNDGADYNYAYSLEGALLHNSAVCSGYTKAYQYLLSIVGISSALVSGESKGDSHAWLVVLLDGNYYYSDITWADQTESKTSSAHINHYYFAMTTQQLLTEHIIDKECELFTCNSSSDNYYFHEGLYFTAYDYDAILDACSKVQEKFGRDYIEFYISDKAEYEKAQADLVDNYYAGDLGMEILGNKCDAYIQSEEGYMIFFA